MSNLSASERAAIRARAEAATPGPYRLQENVAWVFAPDGDREVAIHCTPLDDAWRVNAGDYRKQQVANARFFAHAREDVPRLLDALDAETARADVAEARAAGLRAALAGVLRSFDDLVAESYGVTGLHRNGDVAPWNELLEGGHFEEWTEPQFSIARAALNNAPAAKEADHGTSND